MAVRFAILRSPKSAILETRTDWQLQVLPKLDRKSDGGGHQNSQRRVRSSCALHSAGAMRSRGRQKYPTRRRGRETKSSFHGTAFLDRVFYLRKSVATDNRRWRSSETLCKVLGLA